MYTTGEIAKLCGVTVRCVQYYDSRKILVPSEISEGGRRLYSDDDVKKLKTICFLREIGISINDIVDLLADDSKGEVIELLLDNRKNELNEEIDKLQNKVKLIENIKKEIKNIDELSIDSINSLTYIIDNKKNMKKLHITLLAFGIPLNAFEIVSILLWIFYGNYILFICFAILDVIFGIFLIRYYYKHTIYVCPKCHSIFKPKLKEMLFANHRLSLRKLTCTCCGYKGFCVETYRKDGD